MTILRDLKFAVQYRPKSGNRSWYTMAAFDIKIIADRYARECRDDRQHDDLEYRVIKIADTLAELTS